MILVARRFGFSMWLMIWEAASLPSWPAPMSIDVNCGEVSLANQRVIEGDDLTDLRVARGFPDRLFLKRRRGYRR